MKSDKSLLRRMAEWHETQMGLLVYGLAELALAVVFILWAIDSGSLLDWFFVFVLLIGGFQNLGKLIYRHLHAR